MTLRELVVLLRKSRKRKSFEYAAQAALQGIKVPVIEDGPGEDDAEVVLTEEQEKLGKSAIAESLARKQRELACQNSSSK